ncbi:MAG: hypothetical protein WCA09_08045 [Burkholderiales bacterium]
MKKLISLLSLLAAFAVAAPVHAQNKESADTNMQILRDKIKADKKALVATNMELNDKEAKAFWPLYDSYQKELETLNKRTLDLIVEYADAYNNNKLTDALAGKLIKEMVAIEGAEAAMRKREAAKLVKAIPAKKAARYLQIESKIRAVIKFDLASQIPLVE